LLAALFHFGITVFRHPQSQMCSSQNTKRIAKCNFYFRAHINITNENEIKKNWNEEN